MVFQLIQDNFVAVAITLFLILFILTNNNFPKGTNRQFLFAAFSILILIVSEAYEAVLAKSPTYEFLRVPLSALGYTLRPVVPYLLILMAISLTKKRFILVTIPMVANTLVAFSALFCDISFSYTPDNRFARGPLGYTPFVVAAIYIAVLLVHTIYECRNGNLTEAMIVSAIVLLTFLSTVMESVYGFRFIQSPCMAISVTFYYLFQHCRMNNRDPLTGALVRRRIYLDAEKYASSLTAVISLDINDLKLINDKYGHQEGDRAIIAISYEIKKYTGVHSTLYRLGGDEFVLLCYRMTREDVEKLISRLQEDLRKTKYRCAIGYAMESGQPNLDALLHEADNMMYEIKRKMKASSGEN